MRASTRQEQLIRAAAAASDTTLTDFILDTAVTQAEKLLADRRYFLLDEQEWDAFERVLDAPVPATPKLDALLSAPSPFTGDE
ncbi:MAG: DUF1778 domain-containing protein [Egibacteraceae bacterium]